MKYARLSTLLLLIAGLATLGATAENASALGSDTVWTGTGDGETWDSDDNWSQQRPDGTKRAIIDADVTVIIDITDAEADSLEIGPDAVLRIESGNKLRLEDGASPDLGDSLIEGVVEIEKGASLQIDVDLVIEGDGGTITGTTVGSGATPRIYGTQTTDTLTIDNAGLNPSLESDSLVINGNLDIQVELVNNAFVVAEGSNTLTLSGQAKSGSSGFWCAEDTATLKVDSVTVTGSSEWRLITHATATIWITSSATTTSLSGDFTIKLGKLDIDADLDTTGELTFESVNGSNPRIEVASGVTADFS